MIKNDVQYDVIVVGAGPGGSAAAYFASKAGLKVLLIDQKEFPRSKVCSGGLSPKALTVLEEMGVLEEIEHSGRSKIKSLRLGSPSGIVIDGNIPITPISQGFGYVVPRFQLDDMVRRQAVQVGAVFKKGRADLLWSNNSVHSILVNEQEIKAGLIILANGASGQPVGFFAIQTHYEDNKLGDSTTVEIYFERSLLPGYFWIFPQGNGHMTVGAGAWGNPGGAKALQDRYEAGVRYTNNVCHKLLPPSDTLEFEKWIIPAKRSIRPAVASNVLLVGDAGGFANPFTGEGIYYALETGRIAGQTVADHLLKANNFRSIAEDYEARLSGVLADLNASWLLHDMICNPSLVNNVIDCAARDELLKMLLIGAMLNASEKSELLVHLKT